MFIAGNTKNTSLRFTYGYWQRKNIFSMCKNSWENKSKGEWMKPKHGQYSSTAI